MGTVTKIAWTDHTFNPWVGCQAVSPGCDHCYAQALTERFGNDFAVRRRAGPTNWKQPIRWDHAAEDARKPARVFCASMADVFDNHVDPEWRRDLWCLVRATPWLDWQILTKRPQNIGPMLPPDWSDGYHNVWLGVSVENQIEADRRIRYLRAIPARVRFLAVEPMLEPVVPYLDGIHWVICGGESGPKARPMIHNWAAGLRDQCKNAGVAFFFKQYGNPKLGDRLDGRQWQQFPGDHVA